MRHMTLMMLFSSSFWALLAAVPLQQQNSNYQIIGENYLVPDSETQQSSDAWSSKSFEYNPLIKAAGQVSVVRVKRDATTTQSTPPKKAQFEKSKRGFEKDCLRAHNKWRRLHGAPDLKFDKKIAAFSQKRADFIAASDGDKFEHPPGLPFGENLAWHSNAKTSCHDLIKMWYDEIKLYDFSNPKFSMETGHFTQLVWKGTTKLGCAGSISSGPKGGIYLVCNYDPPGNYLGEFEENVLRPRGTFESGDTSTTTVATTTMTINKLPTTTATAIIPPNVKPVTTAISSTTSTTEATTTVSASITTKRPDKRKKKNKNKKKKNKTDKEKEKEKKKDKKKKGNKKKNRRKNKKKATSSTTSTTSTTTTAATPTTDRSI